MIQFSAFGHENIKSAHNATLEFTKDSDLSKKGDCIIAVSADFDAEEIVEFARKFKKAKCMISAGGEKDEFSFELNPRFCSRNEIVIRISDFVSERTLGTRSDKAASGIRRKLVSKMKNPDVKMDVRIYPE